MPRMSMVNGYINMKNEMPTERQMDLLKFLASDYELPVSNDPEGLSDGRLDFSWSGDAKKSGISALHENFAQRIANFVADPAAEELKLSGYICITTTGWGASVVVQKVYFRDGQVSKTKGRVQWDEPEEVLPFNANRYES